MTEETVDAAARPLTEPVETQVVWADGRTQRAETEALREHTLDILVNLQHVARLVCTRASLPELVTGFLCTEGVIDRAAEIERLYLCRSEHTARVFLTKELAAVPALRESKSCCTGSALLLKAEARRPLRRVEDRSGWRSADIFRLAAAMRQELPLHAATDSTHFCLLMRRGEICFACEDIGRHNALDKAVGFALRSEIPLSECIVYTSGRVPVDMVEKAVAAGIPVLVSKATATAESALFAAECGMTLICRAWEDRYELCAGP